MRLPTGLLLSGIALTGCDAPDASESPAAPPRAQVVAGNATIRGTVKFTGTVPKTASSPVPCHDGMKVVADESAVVNDNGTLRHVFVYIEGAPATDGSKAAPALLDQVDCVYVPHAVGVQVGQALRVRSSDPTMHNVHSLARSNRPFNLSMTTAGEEKTVTFAKPEFVPLRCDVHPWMTAYVGVFENPWFAVTDQTGAFEIRNVPEGTYKLATWHERYGRLERSIDVRDQPFDVTFEYKQN